MQNHRKRNLILDAMQDSINAESVLSISINDIVKKTGVEEGKKLMDSCQIDAFIELDHHIYLVSNEDVNKTPAAFSVMQSENLGIEREKLRSLTE